MATTPKPQPPQQAAPPLPQPQYGGSYIRHSDGSLQLVERTQDPQPTPPDGADAAPQEQPA